MENPVRDFSQDDISAHDASRQMLRDPPSRFEHRSVLQGPIRGLSC